MKITDPVLGAKTLFWRGRLAMLFIVLCMAFSICDSAIIFSYWQGYFTASLPDWYENAALIIRIASLVVFSMWFYRAYANLRIMGFNKIKWDPIWAVLGCWIVIANLFMPCIIMREIDRLCASKTGRQVKGGAILAWWLIFLFSVLVARLTNGFVSVSGTYEALVIALAMYAIHAALLLVSGVMLLKIMNTINRDQIAIAGMTETASDGAE